MAFLHPLISYRSIVSERNYKTNYVMSAPAGVIGEYDLPDLYRSSSAKSLLLLNPVNALEEPVQKEDCDRWFAAEANKSDTEGKTNGLTLL
jgi:hypothetical protein